MLSCLHQVRRRLAQWSVLLGMVCLYAIPLAHASGGGGHGGGGGPAPMDFVVNIGSGHLDRMVLQMSIVLEPATPEAAKLMDSHQPIIRHRVMIVTSRLSAEELRKPEIRHDLGEKIVEAINDELGTTKKDGVKELFFTSFLYQRL